MRIAIFTDVFLEVSGGIPSSIESQRKNLEELGHEVVIFAPGWHKKTINGVSYAIVGGKVDKKIIIIPTAVRFFCPGGAPLSRWPGLIIKYILKIYPNFKEYFDLIHVHYEAGCSIAGLLMAERLGIPAVQTMHGREDVAIQVNVPHPFECFVGLVLDRTHGFYIKHQTKITKDNYLAPTWTRSFMWQLMVNHANFAGAVITPSEHFANKLRHYGVTRAIHIVPNGIADEIVENPVEVHKLASGQPLKILWNSRVSNEKRIMQFLKAIALVEGKYQLTVCGDGNALNRAKKFANENNLNVKFLGRVNHKKIWELMKTHDISATVSYDFDTQGMTLIEAEAAGLPVFFCDPDMREVVPTDGAVMSGKEPEEMAAELDDLIKHPERIERMSQVMIKHRAEVAQKVQIEKLLALYQKMI